MTLKRWEGLIPMRHPYSLLIWQQILQSVGTSPQETDGRYPSSFLWLKDSFPLVISRLIREYWRY